MDALALVQAFDHFSIERLAVRADLSEHLGVCGA
jgi:hypothetical protein